MELRGENIFVLEDRGEVRAVLAGCHDFVCGNRRNEGVGKIKIIGFGKTAE